MERLFVLKTLSRTQRTTKVKKFVGFSLKPLRCRDPALPTLYSYMRSAIFFRADAHAHYNNTYHVVHLSGHFPCGVTVEDVVSS